MTPEAGWPVTSLGYNKAVDGNYLQSFVFSHVLHSSVLWVLYSEWRYITDIRLCNTQIPGE